MEESDALEGWQREHPAISMLLHSGLTSNASRHKGGQASPSASQLAQLFFPKQCLHYGVLAYSRAGEPDPDVRVFPDTQNH